MPGSGFGSLFFFLDVGERSVMGVKLGSWGQSVVNSSYLSPSNFCRDEKRDVG